MALPKKDQSLVPVVDAKNNAVAFVNWNLPLADGRMLRSSKGFPIFQNPKYPNKNEDILVNLAKKHGGTVTVTMECRIMLNTGATADDFDLDQIVVTPTEVHPQPAPTEIIQ